MSPNGIIRLQWVNQPFILPLTTPAELSRSELPVDQRGGDPCHRQPPVAPLRAGSLLPHRRHCDSHYLTHTAGDRQLPGQTQVGYTSIQLFTC